VNDAPSSASQEATTLEDTPKPLTLGGADVDGDALSYEIVSGPEHGSISGDVADRTYTPAANYHGPDSFTYRVSDGSAESEVATVTLTVEAVNDAPTATDQDVATPEDTAKALTLAVADADGDPLAFEIVSGPAHGDLSGTGSDRTYTPHPDYYGSDQFSYTVSDGSASSTVATVSLTVAEVNDSPTAAADVEETAEDTELVVSAAQLLANDGTGPPNEASQSLTLTGVGSAVGGTVAYDPAMGEVRFAPDEHFHGTASFTYVIADDGQTDGAADPKAAEGTATVNVSSVNDEPVATDGDQSTTEDEPVTFALPASDADGDALQFTIEVQPLHGEVTALDGDQVTYTPAPNYWGPDTFTFVASDGSSSSSSGAISIDVASVNDAPALDASGSPKLTPVKANASEPAGDTVADILASGAVGDHVITDIDGDPSGIAVVSVDGSGGTWEYRTVGGTWTSLDGIDASAAQLLDLDSTLRFVPVAGFSGDATIRFRAWDHSIGAVGGTADATITGGSSAFSADYEEAVITVIPNVPPVAVDDTASTTEDSEVTIDVLANDSDADGEPLTVAVETQPDGGAATVVDGVVQFRPSPDRNGTDRFTYTVRDPRGGVATGTVDVTITPENDLPITHDDTETVAEDGIVVFDPTGNDTAGPLEESLGALRLSTITAPAQHGTAAVTGGTIRYMPTLGFTGSDVLTYEVCDDATPALCNEANVTLTVSRVAATVETDPVPHAPQYHSNGSVKVVDAADDPAIWVNPLDPAQSLIIGTNKFSDTTNGGLLVYDLEGNQLSYTNDGPKNNVDLRPGFPLGGHEVTLVTASQRNDPPYTKRVAIYTLDPSTKELTLAGEVTPEYEPLGDCMYRSAKTGDFYVFVVSANGYVQQWRLAEAPGGTGTIDATEVRLFRVSATGSSDIAEGCVADDGLGHLYVSEEDVGVWKYSAEPDGGMTRTQVDVVGGGQLTADVEGLTIAYGPGDTGYLIASSQGSSSFAVYRRDGDNAFVRSFKIKDAAVDGTTITDGIDVTTAPLGPAFPNGMFVAHDNNNLPDNQNFKLVPLEQIVPTAALVRPG
jgi:large repetitive protein